MYDAKRNKRGRRGRSCKPRKRKGKDVGTPRQPIRGKVGGTELKKFLIRDRLHWNLATSKSPSGEKNAIKKFLVAPRIEERVVAETGGGKRRVRL